MEQLTKISTASQASLLRFYKDYSLDRKYTFFRIWFLKQCKRFNVFPKFITKNLRSNINSRQATQAITTGRRHWLNSEIKSAYTKLQHISKMLFFTYKILTYKLHYLEFETFDYKVRTTVGDLGQQQRLRLQKKLEGLKRSQDHNITTGIMEETANNNSNAEHQLWVQLSALAESNVFGLLPRLIQDMLGSEPLLPDDLEDSFSITLPSDYEWRTKIYLKLLQQRRSSQSMEEPIPEKTPVLHDWNIVPGKTEKPFCAPDAERLAKREVVSGPGPITWTVSDIAKAACLLSTPPQRTLFGDEQEMRRVYTLIYDVYRYKSILTQALNDIAFFYYYPELNDQHSRVWLLLYDLYHRSFKKRETKLVPFSSKLFAECGLVMHEGALWTQRVKLAAAVARLRIQNSALRLSDLLPPHLRDEQITSLSTVPVTCWVNIKKSKNRQQLSSELETKLGLTQVDPDLTLGPAHFKWDAHCPQFIIFHPSVRTKLAQSSLVKKHKLIVQSKAFCVGPATFGKILSDLQLTGSVIQTHVNSPRTVAYLATLLSQNDKIKKLLAFSAGNKKKEYENYMSDLGMKNILIYSEKLIDLSPDAGCLEEVIAVFATPPNSYTAVADPIDLVCSRGGDLTMLEILTEHEETKQTRERVANVLEEQRKTLRYAMSRPQIQLVLYETHSQLDAENEVMVQRAVKDVNRIAKLHHATLQGRLLASQTDLSTTEINNNEKEPKIGSADDLEARSATSKMSTEEIGEGEVRFEDVVVPDCDLFDLPEIPDLCPNVANPCNTINQAGCYLALLQRKQVTNLDNKYMIQIAESRGLFGIAQASSKKSGKSSKTKKQEVVAPPPKPKKKQKNIEVDRIAAPTVASVGHSKLTKQSDCSACCPKRIREETHQGATPQPRQWWCETTRHITNLRTSLVKQKVLPPVEQKKDFRPTAKNIVSTLMHATQKIDEIVAKGSKRSNIPIFPKLRLTRRPVRKEKIPCPITVTLVRFSSNRRVNLNCQ